MGIIVGIIVYIPYYGVMQDLYHQPYQGPFSRSGVLLFSASLCINPSANHVGFWASGLIPKP